MIQKHLIAVACAAALLCAGCPPRPEAAAPLELSSLPTERVALPLEWRDARAVPAGTWRMALGETPRQAALRLEVLPVDGDTLSVEVTLDGHTVAAFIADRPGEWLDRRFDFERFTQFRGRDCAVTFQSAKGFHLGACEVLPSSSRLPNVLVVLVDTLRLDHLSCYGYPLATSPALDELAAKSLLFWNLVPSASWTRPSVATLFTSLHPPAHGAQDRKDLLRPGLPTLAGALARGGYATQGLITNPHLLPTWGFGDGFARYVDAGATQPMNTHERDAQVISRAIEATERLRGRPWFLYVHLMGPHGPLLDLPESAAFLPEKFVGTRPAVRDQKMLAKYDGAILRTDREIARLLAHLRKDRQWDNTLIVVLSDHGEQFGEHGEYGHGMSLFEEELRVPLIVKLPDGAFAGEQRKALAEMRDVAPTILDVAGLPPEPGFQGQSFRTLFARDVWTEKAGYSCLRLDGRDADSAKTRSDKFILDRTNDHTFWYQLSEDPYERLPWCSPRPEMPPLDVFALHRRVAGAPGLHVAVTAAKGTEGTLRLRVEGAGNVLDTAAPEGAVLMERQNDAQEMTIHIAAIAREPEALHAMQGGTWTPLGELVFSMSNPSVLRLTATLDDAVLPVERIYLGEGGAQGPLEGGALDTTALTAGATPDLAAPETGFSVYVWIQAAPAALSKDAMSEDMLNALQALGYVK